MSPGRYRQEVFDRLDVVPQSIPDSDVSTETETETETGQRQRQRQDRDRDRDRKKTETETGNLSPTKRRPSVHT